MMVIALIVTGVAVLLYLVVGSLTDWRRARRQVQSEEAMTALAESAFLDHDSAGEALGSLRNVPPKVLWNLALTVPLHFDDQLSRRVVSLIGATNARRRVERLSSSRFWFRRVQAARLAHVLPEQDADIVRHLLRDPSPAVQAAVIESFGTDAIAQYAKLLLERLNHPSQSVRFTAQQALLRGDGRVTDHLREWLLSADGDVAHSGLEVAAHLDDPRLVVEISRFASSPDPRIRRLVARGTPVGTSPEDLTFFRSLLEDQDPLVRATAMESSTRIDADWLLPQVAKGLTDPSWKVRRAAGEALSKSGALGDLYLRAGLDCQDPYAADMSRYFLEMSGRMEELNRRPLGEEVDSLSAWAQR